MSESEPVRAATFYHGLLSVVAVLLAGVPAMSAAQQSGAADRALPQAGDLVAVVPFTNITGLPADEWIGAGIAETVAVDLERAADLATVAGEAAEGVSARAAGRRMGAPWVVAGGYQRSGDRIRITARLVHVATGMVSRTANVTGPFGELFALQDQLATALAGELAAPAAGPASAVPEPAQQPPTAAPPTAAAPAGAARAPGRAGFAPPVSGRAIDGPPAPVAPETMTRDADGRATVRALRLQAPPSLDGVLGEAVYAQAPPISGFIQQLPDEGAPATERTEVWVLYDAEHVYVAARCWDSTPEAQWIANEMQRDSFQLINNDWFSVAFDTFYDRRNGLAFLVNPIGGFFDYEISDEGSPNNDWNPVWDVRTGRFAGGWTVEMQIPFKSLRFQQGTAQLWGVQFARRLRGRNETSHLTPVPISAGPGIFRLSVAATLVGLEAAAQNRRLEVKPYGIGSLETDLTADAPFTNRGDGDAGIDAKWGVTRNLTADFTYNTDFAQVEVDQQQVNLTRFSLFFPEKREFFLEARGIFDFGAGPNVLGTGGGDNGGRLQGPPGTRFGSDVPLVFFSRRIGLQDDRTVPIVGGGRLTGKVGRFSIGAVNMQTGDAPDAGALATNFTVVRVKRDVLRRSRVGAIFTRRSVSLDRTGSNDAWGLDGAFAFHDNVTFNGYYARTRTRGRAGDDASYQAAFTYDGDLYGVQVDHLLVGGNFNPEVGFLRREDFRRTFLAAQYRPRPRGIEAIRQFTFGASLDYIENGERDLETRAAGARFVTELENSDRLTVDLLRSYELLVEPFDVADDVAIPVGGYSFHDVFLSYLMGQQRPVSGTAFVQHGQFFAGRITGLGYRQGRIGVTPRLSIEPTVAINRIRLPQGRFTATVATTRATYTFTSRMFLSGLAQYNSSTERIGTNVRFRWEYDPGSELFVVYNDQRDVMLRGAPRLETRALVVKFTRLIRF